MTSNIDREQERPTATGATGSVEPTRDRRAPKIAVGDTSAVQDRTDRKSKRCAPRSSSRVPRIAYAAYFT
ncbi:MAG: hypothetical protein ACLTKG_09135 [Collinsella intestinalis]